MKVRNKKTITNKQPMNQAKVECPICSWGNCDFSVRVISTRPSCWLQIEHGQAGGHL